MIAQFDVVLPFEFTVPEKEIFCIREYQLNNYKIQIMHPIKIDVSTGRTVSGQVLLNGKKAFIANGLRIIFCKKKFQRTIGSEVDPPLHFIEALLNLFLNRVRFVTRYSKMRVIDLNKETWRIRYLKDDNTELRKNKKYARGKVSRAFKFEWTAMDSKIWEDIFSLPFEYIPPQWEMTLIDAAGAFPAVGQAIALAAISLEIFISHVLDEMSRNVGVSETIWGWIFNRKQFINNPQLSEKYDSLLKAVAGFSLKENKALWKSFKNIREARNKYLHDGVATIEGKEVTEKQARSLVHKAQEIIYFVQYKLPEGLRWPVFEHKVNISFTQRIK